MVARAARPRTRERHASPGEDRRAKAEAMCFCTAYTSDSFIRSPARAPRAPRLGCDAEVAFSSGIHAVLYTSSVGGQLPPLTAQGACESIAVPVSVLALGVGYAIFSASSAFRIMRETMRRAFPLSSAAEIIQPQAGLRCTRRAKAFLISLHILLPERAFLQVRKGELPVLLRVIDALEEALALLLLREVEVELDDAGSVSMEVSLQVHDGSIPLMPDALSCYVPAPATPHCAESPDERALSALPRNRTD